MSEKYDRVIASHYSAYRPPLHDKILKYVISENEIFFDGLDVGCGTGYSTIALAKYCSQVYGVEPSESMLLEATTNDKITYYQGYGSEMPIDDSSVDIVTFAGSLSYAKSPVLVEELRRVCRKPAIIIPYDFEVLLDGILARHGIDLKKPECYYNHRENFSHDSNFIEIVDDRQQIDFELRAFELAHVLLSSSSIYDAIVEKFASLDVFSILVDKLESSQRLYTLKANIYFSRYRLNC